MIASGVQSGRGYIHVHDTVSKLFLLLKSTSLRKYKYRDTFHLPLFSFNLCRLRIFQKIWFRFIGRHIIIFPYAWVSLISVDGCFRFELIEQSISMFGNSDELQDLTLFAGSREGSFHSISRFGVFSRHDTFWGHGYLSRSLSSWSTRSIMCGVLITSMNNLNCS